MRQEILYYGSGAPEKSCTGVPVGRARKSLNRHQRSRRRGQSGTFLVSCQKRKIDVQEACLIDFPSTAGSKAVTICYTEKDMFSNKEWCMSQPHQLHNPADAHSTQYDVHVRDHHTVNPHSPESAQARFSFCSVRLTMVNC